MNDQKEKTATEALRETIIATAAEAVVAQMTPTMMRRIAEEMLSHVLRDLGDVNKYSGLGKAIYDKAEKAVDKYLKTQEAQALIESAVIRGVQEAAKDLDVEVRGELVKTALTGVHKALTEKDKRYR